MTGLEQPQTYNHRFTLECLQEFADNFFFLFSSICIHRILESDLLSLSKPELYGNIVVQLPSPHFFRLFEYYDHTSGCIVMINAL